MASATCWRCLLRPSDRTAGRSLQLRAFTTFPRLNATKAPARKAVEAPRSGTLRIKKKAFVKTGRPVSPGERKAYRKRVVLSNGNALAVQGMQDLSAETTADEALKGEMLGLPGVVVDQLRAVGAFRPTQGWGLFRKPATLAREETVRLWTEMHEVEGGGERRTLRKIISGERGVGKSLLLLQVMAMAFSKGWVVINIPEAQDITIAHTDYAPIAKTDPTQYQQKAYTASLLGQVSKANNAVLSGLQLSQSHTLPISLQSNISLSRLADLGARDPEIAWPIFQALWKELTTPSTTDAPRPPVLFSLDGLAHTMRASNYRAQDFSPIHAHELALVAHFVSHLSGQRSLPNGGAIIAATSASNSPRAPTYALALSQLEARAAGVPEADIPAPSPFDAHNVRVLSALRNLDVIRLRGLSRDDEARGLLEYYAASGLLREKVSAQSVAERWTLAGGGVVGELERAVRGMRL
ncbi:MAG: 37S ribosomal protein S23 mitochondrial [Thelocarpon impressellum]|nr:MAG: 37S ribosomal protein S23 mitochondrial [Thelocarpon impressellum]